MENDDILNSRFCIELGKDLSDSLPKFLEIVGKERIEKVINEMKNKRK